MKQNPATDSVAKANVHDHAQGGFDMQKYLKAALLAVLATFFVVIGKANASITRTVNQQAAVSTASQHETNAKGSQQHKAAPATSRHRSAIRSRVTLGPVLTGGLDKHNAGHAWSQFRGRADYDSALGQALARATGAVAYNASDFQVDTHSKCRAQAGYSCGAPPGSTNSGVVLSTGALSSAQDTSNCNIHSQMLVVVNIHTEAKAYICVNCANPRLFAQSPPAFHPFAKTTSMHYHKTVTKPMVCPNGTPVAVTATIDGLLKAKMWGQVAGILKARLSAAFNAKLKINVKCGSAPPPCQCAGVPTFLKRWFNAAGGDVTLGKTSESIPFTAFDNGRVYPLTIHPGAAFSIPSVVNGDDVKLCEDAAYRGIHNVSLLTPSGNGTGAAASDGCVTFQNVHGTVFIDNREGGGSSPPPVCTSNCGGTVVPPPVVIDHNCNQILAGSFWSDAVNACVVVVCGSVVIVNGNNNIINQGGNCNTAPPPPPPPVTPPPAPKPTGSIDTVQEFDTSDYSTSPPTIAKGPVRLHVQAKAGDSLSGTCHVGLGSLDRHDYQVTATGSDQVVTFTYTAPTEPGQDQVICTLTDNTVNTQADPQPKSNVFDITAPKPNP